MVEVLADVLNDAALPLRNSRVLVLGVAYKANISDMRESPALEVITHLQKKHALVDYNDPFVATLQVGERELRSIELSAEALSGYQAVVVVTDHKAYDWDFVLRHSVRIVDGRNATLAARKRAPELAGKVRAI